MDKFPRILQALIWFLFLFGILTLVVLVVDSLR